MEYAQTCRHGTSLSTYFVSNIDSESVITVPGQSKNIVETVKTVDKCNKSRLDLSAGTELL